MKYLSVITLLIASVSLTFFSCKKEDPLPTNYQTITNPPSINPIGKTWELFDGKVYVKNLDNGSTFYYDHFSNTKNASNLDVFQASWLPIDIISKGITTWKFSSSGQFFLDGSSSYNYNLNSNGIFSVYGLENGSARIIKVLSSTSDVLIVKVFESTGNNGVNNFSFYSVLTFVNAGYMGNVSSYPSPNGYTYSGIIGNPTNTSPSLVGTKWIITKYIQNFVPTYPNDTIVFVSNTKYTINSGSLRNYSLSSIVGNNMSSLALYSFTTMGGDWSGQVQNTFINDWVINNSVFTNIMSSGQQVNLWAIRKL
jgi:hypothetical protein